MKQPLIFPAIFQKDNSIYNVHFPDVEGAFTFGESFEEALYMAKDCLELALYEIEKIPTITDLEHIHLQDNEHIVLIQADMFEFNKKIKNKTIKKTLTLPQWLNDLGVEKGLNFSKILQKALIKELNIV